ncbi:hypothetical protein K503DRAFT_851608 [Rhizopogon vinicolor AM-OR11-026]|uniref:Uncharacterized protein n=1 Tax=Rhizopogon vinicolor AM-OR11-026 TaxID=1314800 RepID=A0A1B7MPD6_9AGAM|nr:hypothetical protein K503DRAFT_851608 [Rhizopogon vinicolor AM-OR11-026]
MESNQALRGRSRSRSQDRIPTYDRKVARDRESSTADRHTYGSSRHLGTLDRERDAPRRSRSPHRSRGYPRSRSRSPRHKRSRSRSRGPDRSAHSRETHERHKGRDKHRHKRSRSRSSSPSTSSDSDSERRRRKKKDKHRSREEKRERKKEKKEKKKKRHATASGAQWGKYGVINETDFYNKTQEFRTWLLEERKINPEAITKDQERKEFAVFVEDYNTATLPHEKYYHMEAYDRRMTSLRAGEFVPPAEDSYNPEADLRAHSLRHKKAPTEHESYLSKEELMELRKVQSERVEVGKRKLLGMEVKQNMGVRMDRTMFDD